MYQFSVRIFDHLVDGRGVDVAMQASRKLARREGTSWIGYGAPVLAAAVSAWAFFGAGRYDPTATRLSLEIFGTLAGIGAVLPSRSAHVGLLAFAAAGFGLTGLFSLATVGPLAWLAGALCVVAIVDAAHAADREGSSLGRVPLAGALAAGLVAALVKLLF